MRQLPIPTQAGNLDAIITWMGKRYWHAEARVNHPPSYRVAVLRNADYSIVLAEITTVNNNTSLAFWGTDDDMLTLEAGDVLSGLGMSIDDAADLDVSGMDWLPLAAKPEPVVVAQSEAPKPAPAPEPKPVQTAEPAKPAVVTEPPKTDPANTSDDTTG